MNGFKINYFVIAFFTLMTGILSTFFMQPNLDWYRSLKIPANTPPVWFALMIWAVALILAALSAGTIWNKTAVKNRWKITGLYIVIALLIIVWSALFFYHHALFSSVLMAIALLVISTILLVFLLKESLKATLLFLPYFILLCFDVYITYQIWRLN